MRPAGLHTHDSDLAEVIGALVLVAGVAVAVEFILSIIWIIAVIVGVTVVAGIVLLVWMARRGSAFAVVSRSALPPSQATPIAPRPAQALPAPQTVNFNFYGVSAAEAAEVVEQQRQAIGGSERIEG